MGESLFGCRSVFLRHLVWERHLLVNKNGLPRVDAPSHCRRDLGRVEGHDVVVFGIRVGCGCLPAGDGCVPVRALRRVGTAFEILESGFIGVYITHARATFDGHVANGHTLLLCEGVEGRSSIFVGVAETAIHPEFADDVQDDILRIHAGTEFSIHIDAADLGLVERHGLSSEDIAHLAGADAKGDRTECSMGRGVRVAAGDRGAGLGDALLGANDVDDALLAGGEVEKSDAVFRAIRAQGLDHGIREFVAEWLGAFVRGHDVVHRGKSARGVEHLEIQVAQHAEGLWAGNLMDEVGADQKLGGSIRKSADGVGSPHLVE